MGAVAHEKTNDSLFEGESRHYADQRRGHGRNTSTGTPSSLMAQTQQEEYLAPLSSLHDDRSYLQAFRNVPNANQVVLRPPRASPRRERSTVKRPLPIAPERPITTPFPNPRINDIRFSTVHGSRKKSHAHPMAQESLDIQRAAQGLEQPPLTAQPRAMRFMHRRFTTQDNGRTHTSNHTHRELSSEQASFKG